MALNSPDNPINTASERPEHAIAPETDPDAVPSDAVPNDVIPIDVILVPQGAEAAAVRRGLRLAQASTPVLTIAMGPAATAQCLTSALAKGTLRRGQRVLVLGVAGSLSPALGVGDGVIYERVVDGAGQDLGMGDEVDFLSQRLPQAQRVTALHSDRLLHRASDKQTLQTVAQAVDMEAQAVIQVLEPEGIAIATVRIISDDIHTDLPDMARATRADGTLDPLALAWTMLRQPKPALSLIRGSLKSLKVLEQVTAQIFAR